MTSIRLLIGDSHGSVASTTSQTPDRFLILGGVGGTASRVVVRAPPFVSERQHARYTDLSDGVAFLNFSVDWTIRTYPGRLPRLWRQRIRDGHEMADGGKMADADGRIVDLRIEIGFAEFCAFIVGSQRLRDMPGASHVDGSLGALSTLHWLVEQPTWLRAPGLVGVARDAAVLASRGLI